jgi:hypothetical protein
VLTIKDHTPKLLLKPISALLLTTPQPPISLASRPNILLINPHAPHALDNPLGLLLIHTTLLSNNLGQHLVHLTRHVRRIATHVEIALLLQQVVDKFGVLLDKMLDIDLLAGFAREGVEDCEFVTEG